MYRTFRFFRKSRWSGVQKPQRARQMRHASWVAEEQRRTIALNRARQLNDHSEAAQYLNQIGDACRQRGDASKAIEHHRNEIREAKLAADASGSSQGCRIEIALAHRFLSLAYSADGEVDRAIDSLLVAQAVLGEVRDMTRPSALRDHRTSAAQARARVHRRAIVELQRAELQIGNNFVAKSEECAKACDVVRSVVCLHREALPAFHRSEVLARHLAQTWEDRSERRELQGWTREDRSPVVALPVRKS